MAVPDALKTLLESRRSIRRYCPSPVDRGVVESLIASAVLAPSAHNRQPWRFLVLESAAAKRGLALAMGERLRSDRLRDGDDPALVEADASRSYARLTGAPVVVLVCLSMADMDRYPDERRNAAERMMAVQGTAMAAGNLLLAAHAAGLGACWLCAPLFCADQVARAVNLSDGWEPQGIITLGYPADAGKPFNRRPLEDVVRYESVSS